ncbi:hypothetical protein ABZ470_39670 [Streptosporangium sp. NPDC020072]|uniref:hypothetical protein n=1 Tax=Streptosporangium sp. NPDC020072 TaxID=3154788 RepID=UPI0034175140
MKRRDEPFVACLVENIRRALARIEPPCLPSMKPSSDALNSPAATRSRFSRRTPDRGTPLE